MQTVTFDFHGHTATVIRPENPNGKWIWKTEFLYAFDQAEVALTERGYTRVYYSISDKYGSYSAVRLMHDFYHFVKKEFSLSERCCLFGFSRGGLYAFNFALFYPEYVEKVYLDAPVLDMRSWPPAGSRERDEVYKEYSLNAETITTFGGHPVENLAEFFSHGLPVLLVAGGADEVVPYPDNGEKMVNYAKAHGHSVTSIVKPECGHHPHSLTDVTPIIEFIEK